MRYVAFLRGINVGGHRPLKMADVRAAFEGLGFGGVVTVQASGNVVFEAGADGGADSLAARIAGELRRAFGYPIGVVIRPLADLERLVGSHPFKGIAVGPDTRLYVTFLSHPAKNGTRIRPEAASGSLQLVEVTAGEILTAITLSPKWGTTEPHGLAREGVRPRREHAELEHRREDRGRPRLRGCPRGGHDSLPVKWRPGRTAVWSAPAPIVGTWCRQSSVRTRWRLPHCSRHP